MLLYVTFLIYLVGMIGANERYCVPASPAYPHIYTCSYIYTSRYVDIFTLSTPGSSLLHAERSSPVSAEMVGGGEAGSLSAIQWINATCHLLRPLT